MFIELSQNALIGIGACCSYLSNYDYAIHYYTLLMELNQDVQIKYICKFNIALCNYRLKKYDEALSISQDLQERFKTTPPTMINEFQVENLLGVCLLKLKSFNKAISVFKGLLKDSKSENDEFIVLTNLADVYEELKDFDNLAKTCAKIKTRIENNSNFMNSYEGDLYITLAKNLKFMGDIRSSTILLLKSLECFKNGDSKICLEDMEMVFSKLLSIFINDADTNNIEFLRNEFFELVKKEMLPRGNTIGFKFIKYYTYTNQPEKINNIVDFLVS